eukprot:TRINITY_DN9349_c0_g1_i1.p1 TRINITY_DN9349_c0_g1~~TRINITY_DN9349_c0_g1_i1.p1  ORF type:complete len:297 (-),score=32.41 TRINITY_DN9349_c0_g1_i1:447-1337(-)
MLVSDTETNPEHFENSKDTRKRTIYKIILSFEILFSCVVFFLRFLIIYGYIDLYSIGALIWKNTVDDLIFFCFVLKCLYTFYSFKKISRYNMLITILFNTFFVYIFLLNIYESYDFVRFILFVIYLLLTILDIILALQFVLLVISLKNLNNVWKNVTNIIAFILFPLLTFITVFVVIKSFLETFDPTTCCSIKAFSTGFFYNSTMNATVFDLEFSQDNLGFQNIPFNQYIKGQYNSTDEIMSFYCPDCTQHSISYEKDVKLPKIGCVRYSNTSIFNPYSFNNLTIVNSYLCRAFGC